jgi:TolB-like protein
MYVLVAALAIAIFMVLLGSLQTTKKRQDSSSTSKTSIAVLPFVNMNLTKGQEYFSGGAFRRVD